MHFSDEDIAVEEAADAAELTRLEAIITENLDDAKNAVGRAGDALREIHDRRLYPTGTFEDYCKSVWGFGRARAYQIMDGGKIQQVLSTRVDTLPTTKAMRELAPLKDKPEKLIEAWNQALEQSEEPTAREVRDIVRPMLGKKRSAAKPPTEVRAPDAEVAPEPSGETADVPAADLNAALAAVSAAVRKAVAIGATTNELYDAYQQGFKP